jgi:hypothetical protein
VFLWFLTTPYFSCQRAYLARASEKKGHNQPITSGTSASNLYVCRAVGGGLTLSQKRLHHIAADIYIQF